MKDLIRESRRWHAQAEDDFRFDAWARTDNGFHDKVCFLSQQAGEKILKARLVASGRRKVRGHSLGEMILTLSEIDPIFKKLNPTPNALIVSKLRPDSLMVCPASVHFKFSHRKTATMPGRI